MRERGWWGKGVVEEGDSEGSKLWEKDIERKKEIVGEGDRGGKR